jgi:hypothetical protein
MHYSEFKERNQTEHYLIKISMLLKNNFRYIPELTATSDESQDN